MTEEEDEVLAELLDLRIEDSSDVRSSLWKYNLATSEAVICKKYGGYENCHTSADDLTADRLELEQISDRRMGMTAW